MLYKSKAELLKDFEQTKIEYELFKSKNLKLDMSRGKPSADQLDLMEGMLSVITKNEQCYTDDNVDTRNYGLIDSFAGIKKFMADLVGVSPANVIVGGNSSLNLMYDAVSRAMTHGILKNTPWSKLDKVKFLCPCPGYDRHFTICQHFGIEMIIVPLNSDGPDMKMVKELVESDESVKGIWCVPKYSNPTGISYSDEVVREFANLKPKASDFRIFWDNAYCVHDLYDEKDEILNILDEAEKAGNENIVYIFASTSKISYPGAGVSVIAASEENIADIKRLMFAQTIGPDKLNHLRHLRYFKDIETVKAKMKEYAKIIAPKFDVVINNLKPLKEEGIISYETPKGGYFISVNTLEGCAKRVVQLCKNAGVVLTGAGATYPLGIDPFDNNIRIAPTYPTISELEEAMKLFCICVKLASYEKLLK